MRKESVATAPTEIGGSKFNTLPIVNTTDKMQLYRLTHRGRGQLNCLNARSRGF